MVAVRVLYPNVGETDAIQPGTTTFFLWDFAEILVDDEEVTEAVAVAVDREGEITADVTNVPMIVDGQRTNSAIRVPLLNLVNGERYKVVVTVTISSSKIAVITIFVPVVAP